MTNNLRVLLVDAHPLTLGMLQQSLSTLAEVAMATALDGPDPLLKAVADDLVDSLMGRQCCPLKLTQEQDQRAMYFQEGQLAPVSYGAMSANAVVFKVLPSTGGNSTHDEANRHATESEDVLLHT